MPSGEKKDPALLTAQGWGMIALLLIAAAVVSMQVRTNRELKAEIEGLRTELTRAQREYRTARAARAVRATPAPKPVVAPVGENNNSGDVARLREELESLRDQVTQIAAVQAAAAGEDAIPVELVPAKEWKNAGWDTPAAAIETFFWAALAGEVKAVSDFILVPDEERTKVDAWFATLSESTRQQYGTPEKLLGLMMAKDAGPLSGMQMLGQRPVNETDVMMKVRFGTNDGDVDDAEYLLRRTPAGYRLVVPADAAEWFGRHLKPEK
jgi:hypothetical protein